MTQLRRDPVVGRWVITEDENPRTPADFHVEPHSYEEIAHCPFCSGNERLTPPEIYARRPNGSAPNTPGWQVRVVPNRFPALQIEGTIDRSAVGLYDRTNGIGAHELIIETPEHNKDLPDLPYDHVRAVLETYIQRSVDLQKDKRFKYLMLFKNYGLPAGATMDHNHAQLIALPMIPKNVLEELEGSAAYYDYRERCIFCDILRQEVEEKERILEENDAFTAFCPFVSRFPFEIWIVPKEHRLFFCQTAPEDLDALARILKDTLTRMRRTLNDPAYNFIIHTGPNDGQEHPGYHWHLEIMPRISRIAGLEWGTGLYVVPTSPETAARYLKK
ncbi:MAG: DUF4931 domain-containing protein [Deltaproteobacteria bacterium]